MSEVDFELDARSGQDGFSSGENFFHALDFLRHAHAPVDDAFRVIAHDVVDGAAGDDVRRERAAGRSVVRQALDEDDLVREFDVGVDATLRVVAGMRGASVAPDADFAVALAAVVPQNYFEIITV